MTPLEEIFLNKKVLIKIPFRDNAGKEIPGKFDTTGGICTFIGPNDFMGYELQVTIDRTPFKINHINDIKIVD